MSNSDIVKEILDSKTMESLGKWLGEVIGDPVKDGVGFLFADALKVKRITNLIRLRGEIEGQSIENFVQVPISFGYKLLEKASIEDNEVLAKRWANLLRNSLDKDYTGKIPKIFIDVLDNLEPIDVKILEYFINSRSFDNSSALHWSDLRDKFQNNKDFNLSEVLLLSIESLESQNLITESYDLEHVAGAEPPANWKDDSDRYVRGENSGKYYLTQLGKSFIRAVTNIKDNSDKAGKD